MIKIDVDFKNETLQSCINMEIGVKPIPTGFDQFIEAVKLIIDWRQDQDHGFELEFNDAYTKLRKKKLPDYGRHERKAAGTDTGTGAQTEKSK